MDLKTLAAKRAECTAEYAGETIKLVYYPHRYTNVVHAKMTGFQVSRTFDELIDVLPSLIAEWDITDGGEPVPIDAEHLQQIDVMLQLELVSAIVNDMGTTRKKARPSPES